MSHPRAKPVFDLLTQEVYESGAEIVRKTGLPSCQLTTTMQRNLSKIQGGEIIDRRRKLNVEGVYIGLDSFQEALSNGERIEVEESIWRVRGFKDYNAYAKTVVGSSECEECGRTFTTNPLIGVPKHCSDECREAANKKRGPYTKTIKSEVCRGNFSGNENKMIGDFGEAFVMSELLYAGYCAGGVDREGLPYDLLIHTEQRILRVQVKTTASTTEQDNGDLTAMFSLSSRKGLTYAEGSLDLFALVHAPSRSFWIIPARFCVGRKGLNLKVFGGVSGPLARQLSRYKNTFFAIEEIMNEPQ